MQVLCQHFGKGRSVGGLATTVLQYQQSIKQLERNGWNHEQVHRRNAVGMIAQERPPALRWRSPMLGHVFGNRRLPNINAELEEFAMDARCAPERVGDTHVPNELTDLQGRLRPPSTNS